MLTGKNYRDTATNPDKKSCAVNTPKKTMLPGTHITHGETSISETHACYLHITFSLCPIDCAEVIWNNSI